MTRVQVQKAGVFVKIETTPVTRGQFGFAEMRLASFEDICGGKICAALDRQHPRDFTILTGSIRIDGFTNI